MEQATRASEALRLLPLQHVEPAGHHKVALDPGAELSWVPQQVGRVDPAFSHDAPMRRGGSADARRRTITGGLSVAPEVPLAGGGLAGDLEDGRQQEQAAGRRQETKTQASGTHTVCLGSGLGMRLRPALAHCQPEAVRGGAGAPARASESRAPGMGNACGRLAGCF